LFIPNVLLFIDVFIFIWDGVVVNLIIDPNFNDHLRVSNFLVVSIHSVSLLSIYHFSVSHQKRDLLFLHIFFSFGSSFLGSLSQIHHFSILYRYNFHSLISWQHCTSHQPDRS
jgi:hypothetical protein